MVHQSQGRVPETLPIPQDHTLSSVHRGAAVVGPTTAPALFDKAVIDSLSTAGAPHESRCHKGMVHFESIYAARGFDEPTILTARALVQLAVDLTTRDKQCTIRACEYAVSQLPHDTSPQNVLAALANIADRCERLHRRWGEVDGMGVLSDSYYDSWGIVAKLVQSLRSPDKRIFPTKSDLAFGELVHGSADWPDVTDVLRTGVEYNQLRRTLSRFQKGLDLDEHCCLSIAIIAHSCTNGKDVALMAVRESLGTLPPNANCEQMQQHLARIAMSALDLRRSFEERNELMHGTHLVTYVDKILIPEQKRATSPGSSSVQHAILHDDNAQPLIDLGRRDHDPTTTLVQWATRELQVSVADRRHSSLKGILVEDAECRKHVSQAVQMSGPSGHQVVTLFSSLISRGSPDASIQDARALSGKIERIVELLAESPELHKRGIGTVAFELLATRHKTDKLTRYIDHVATILESVPSTSRAEVVDGLLQLVILSKGRPPETILNVLIRGLPSNPEKGATAFKYLLTPIYLENLKEIRKGYRKLADAVAAPVIAGAAGGIAFGITVASFFGVRTTVQTVQLILSKIEFGRWWNRALAVVDKFGRDAVAEGAPRLTFKELSRLVRRNSDRDPLTHRKLYPPLLSKVQ